MLFVVAPQSRDRHGPRREVPAEHRVQSGQDQPSRPQRPVEGRLPEPRDDRFPTRDQPRLRAAEELVAAAADQVAAGFDQVLEALVAPEWWCRVRSQHAAALVDQEREAVAMGEVGESRGVDLFDEPLDPVVARVHLEHQGDARPDGALVVADPRAVRRADFDQARAARFEDLRNPERTADLDQFAAGQQDLAAGRQAGECESQRGGVVVDDQGRLGAGEGAHQVLHSSAAVAAPSRIEAHLQIAVGVETIGQVGHDFAGQRRSAQVGVEEDARRVEHAPERRRLGLQRGADAIRDLADRLRQLVVLDSGPDLGPHRVENAGRLDPQRFPSV